MDELFLVYDVSAVDWSENHQVLRNRRETDVRTLLVGEGEATHSCFKLIMFSIILRSRLMNFE